MQLNCRQFKSESPQKAPLVRRRQDKSRMYNNRSRQRLDFKSEFCLIQLEKLQTESFSVVQSVTAPISILSLHSFHHGLSARWICGINATFLWNITTCTSGLTDLLTSSIHILNPLVPSVQIIEALWIAEKQALWSVSSCFCGITRTNYCVVHSSLPSSIFRTLFIPLHPVTAQSKGIVINRKKMEFWLQRFSTFFFFFLTDDRMLIKSSISDRNSLFSLYFFHGADWNNCRRSAGNCV